MFLFKRYSEVTVYKLSLGFTFITPGIAFEIITIVFLFGYVRDTKV